MYTKKAFSQKLFMLRHNNFMTQRELCRITGISQPVMSMLETESHFPNIVNSAKLATHYNITIDDLVGFNASEEEIAELERMFDERVFNIVNPVSSESQEGDAEENDFSEGQNNAEQSDKKKRGRKTLASRRSVTDV